MKFTTKTEYGVICLIYLARHAGPDMITVKDLVRDEKLSSAYIEKILQKLKQAEIVISHQGKQGGYALARKPSEITFKQIVEAVEGSTFDIYCEPGIRDSITCNHFGMCGLRPIWQKSKQLLDDFYSSLTLEVIARGEADVRRAMEGTTPLTQGAVPGAA